VNALLLALALLPACDKDAAGDTQEEDPSYLEVPPEGEGFQLFMETSVDAYSEVWACEVYSLPNEEYAHVNRVEFRQNEGTHHMTLSTLGLVPTGTIAHGSYDCQDLYGDSSLMEDQIMFYGNQGDAEGEMQLPEGVAASFPPGLDIIHEVHYVNTTDEALRIYSRLNAWTIPEDEVEEGIWGGSVRDENINLPAGEQTTEWSRCVMNEDVEVLFLASHMHELGVEFTIAPFDGQTVGDVFYTNDDWHNPLITQYDPPLVIPAGQGFEWSCTWNNTGDQDVSYGPNATDEMCNLAVVHTPFSVTARCEVVETSDGVLWEP
jgi:hypothetical protein